MESGSSNRIDEIEKKLEELNAQRTSLLEELGTLKKSIASATVFNAYSWHTRQDYGEEKNYQTFEYKVGN